MNISEILWTMGFGLYRRQNDIVSARGPAIKGLIKAENAIDSVSVTEKKKIIFQRNVVFVLIMSKSNNVPIKIDIAMYMNDADWF